MKIEGTARETDRHRSGVDRSMPPFSRRVASDATHLERRSNGSDLNPRALFCLP